jgi:transposase
MWYKEGRERQEDMYSLGHGTLSSVLSPASQSHDELIGSLNPGYAGGLAGRQILSFKKKAAGGGAMTTLFVGIDVSKDSSAAQGLGADGEERFSEVFPMDSDGFAKLYEVITRHSADLSEVMVGLESTACYHINLFSFLTAKGITAVVINPLLIANFSKLSLRKTKTDRKDALTIAQFLIAHKDSINQVAVSQDLQDFRDMARERESVCQMICIQKTEMKRLLQTTFPELEKLCRITGKVMLDFIESFPSARLVRAAKPKVIKKMLSRKGVDTRLTFTAEDIIQAANNSVATASPGKELILKGKIATLKHLEVRRDELTEALTEYCRATMVEDLDIVTSVPGISMGTATTFLAELGSIGKFTSYKKVIAFAGIDPSVYQSGKFEGTGKISKRGNRHLRRIIWLMTISVILHNPAFRDFFMRKRKEGQAYKKAVLATSHKLIRVLFALLTKRTHFCASCA